ncbi:MAG: glycosyltransferase family 4 protein [Gemmatimonadota bacterium]|nr:glycosyltransferase family 4 protein [Gemmatimonadota bacterium]MDE3006687.1 glycosyltransferase family 4 protein [Gemmatimonadota bacterium]
MIVVHSGERAGEPGDRFAEVLVPMRKVGPFLLQRGLMDVIRQHRPTTIIAEFNLRNLMSFAAKARLGSRVRWVWWGLDKGASDAALRIKTWLAHGKAPIVFYHHRIRDFFVEQGLDPDRLHVANNTFHVENHRSFHESRPKDIFLNVGTLDPRKQNDVTIRAFKNVLDKTGCDLSLYLIGEGRDRAMLTQLVRDLGLDDRVFLPGKIEDPAVLEEYYARAIASVSFGQAGLAVLQSMAFGVPFVTKKSAISGGEKYNIIDGYNGIFCEDDSAALEEAMLYLATDDAAARTMGSNAYTHYRERASVENMVDGFRIALADGEG